VIVIAVACGGAEVKATPRVHDSAGVQIVDNPPLGPRPVWVVAGDPVFDIGAGGDDASEQLFGVVAAIRLADGRIAIANSGTNEIRTFDAAGAFVRSAGRRGDGPGEFKEIRHLWMIGGDSLVVADRQLGRVSVFDTAGRLGRTTTLKRGAAAFLLEAEGAFSDGTLLASSAVAPWTDALPEPGATRESRVYYRYSSGGEPIDTLGIFPDWERFVRPVGRAVAVSLLPFGKEGLRQVCGDGFYYGSGDAYEIGYYRSDGRLQRLVRRDQANLLMTSADKEQFVAEWVARQPDETTRREVRKMYEGMPFPATMPAYAALRCDDLHNLWVLESRRPSDRERRWSVFDAAGRQLGWVAMPDGLRPRHIGSDFILGIWVDDLGVEHVRLHALQKDGALSAAPGPSAAFPGAAEPGMSG
jgi:hypothetical protein